GGATLGAIKLTADLLYSTIAANYSRMMTLPGEVDTAHGHMRMEGLSGRFGVAGLLRAGNLAIEPFSQFEVTQLKMPAYAETAYTNTGQIGSLNLAFQAKTYTAKRSFVGSSFTDEVALSPSTRLVGLLKGSWVHDFNPERSVYTGFASAPEYSFETFGAAGPKDAAHLDLGAALRGKSYELRVNVGSTLAARYSNLSAEAGIRFVW
ncbi:MAG TPA: autotransporter outer membrane beta-barrel domain-containing protein, partial [Novosphingobium sp.]|nr:autotransporter outer membrane beta-barrel domain-containing protein [Novosphingobium sp.]